MAINTLVSSFDHLYIDEISRQSPLAQRLIKHFPQEKITWVNEAPFSSSKGALTAKEFDRSKKNIFVTPFKGQFFKRCPGARPGLSCCNYFVLNWGLQCNMNCSYCYLQSFINTPTLTLYSNLEDALKELESFAPSLKDQPLRVGTGETVDSLSLDPLTLYSHDLIHFFKDYPHWSLEFKTKSAAVDQFLQQEHGGNVVVSWSINPQYIIEREEHGTANLKDRLNAAEKCKARGFRIAFHIDPMIWHPDWKNSYLELVHDLTERFSPHDMPYISVGALRFQPEQRHMMRERFGMNSLVTSAEMFPSNDGKLRYEQSLRKEMFSFLVNAFKNRSTAWNLFLCMETPETWISSTGQLPQKTEGLTDLFDSRLIRKHQSASSSSAKVQP
ncbi:MAG: hypothetical protein KDD34_01620 [Bdellovibrionales bacterium]|nr:hypothetical protein [Bdellovibrionales bacterium]